MRFLGIGEDADLAGMYLELLQRGHEVRMYVGTAAAREIYGGMVEQCADWRSELSWVREAGRDGVIVFESASRGADQDALRAQDFQVIGGSAYGDRLECDRAFGQSQLAGLGLRSAACHAFSDYTEAINFVRDTRARYVLKSNGAGGLRARNFVGQMDDGRDMVALLSTYRAQASNADRLDFVLMEHVIGVEVGIGAYFDGQEFLQPACLDWEHKRFFPGELGELTGEMGTIVTYRGADALFARTLAHMSGGLATSGYCGYINLNTIVNDDGIWPLEFTSRFGYPGYAICEALHREAWDSIFLKMLRGDHHPIDTRGGYAAGVVLTVPPFPYPYGYEALSKGLPITLDAQCTADDLRALSFAEVERRDGELITSGTQGYVGVATGVGESVSGACERAYALAAKVVVPNLRYRIDIGKRVIDHDLGWLQQHGYMPSQS